MTRRGAADEGCVLGEIVRLGESEEPVDPGPAREVPWWAPELKPRRSTAGCNRFTRVFSACRKRCAIVNGCREYSKADEEEAAWLSGCLLVPREAALVVAMSEMPMGVAAEASRRRNAAR